MTGTWSFTVGRCGLGQTRVTVAAGGLHRAAQGLTFSFASRPLARDRI